MRRRRSLSFFCLVAISIAAVWITIHHPMKVDWAVQHFKRHATNGLSQAGEDSLLRDMRFDPVALKFANVDCARIVDGDETECQRAAMINVELMRSNSPDIRAIREKIFSPEENWFEITRNCENFRKVRKYFAQPLSEEEKAFPIAYVITIHHDLQSFERLLRSTYHPQNLYCVHPDSKSEERFHSGVKAIANCFDNVFIASHLEDVQYTHISRVQADLNCMKDLVTRSPRHGWRYVINLCGQDLPLKTNLEIVRHLKSLVGYNNLETFHTPGHKKRRFQFHFDIPKHGGYSVMERTDIRKEPPPGDVEIYSGSAYYAFKRRAVEYFLADPLIQNLFNWSQDAYSPDEYIWATIQRIYPRVPGSFPPHQKYDLNELTSVTRLVKWKGLDNVVYPKCGGAYRHGICVYGLTDLTWLLSHKHFFANKFDHSVDIFAVECLDSWLRNKTLIQRSIYNKFGFI